MYLPLIGKVQRPLPWLLGLGAVVILGVGIATAAIIRTRTPAYNVAELTVPVEKAEVTVRIRASGTVTPLKTVNLSPRTAGTLAALYVEQGDRVRQGQLIAQMKSDDLEAQLRQNQASLAEAEAALADILSGRTSTEIGQAAAAVETAEAQVRDARARLDLANSQLDRNRQLVNLGAISANDFDIAEREARSAQANLDQFISRVNEARQNLQNLRNQPDAEEVAQAQARVDRAVAQIEATQVLIDESVVRAPFAGVITQKFAVEGAFVTPSTSASSVSSATSTAIVALAEGLEILAEVPEADIGQIKPGQLVEVRADAFPDQTYRGKVRLIAPEAIKKQDVTLFQVRIELLTGQEELLSNMNVDVAFIGDELSDALLVPTVAIVTQDGESGVLVPGDKDRIYFRPVTLGSQVGDQIQILEGVKDGDRVFVDLPPGQKLEDLTFSREQTPP